MFGDRYLMVPERRLAIRLSPDGLRQVRGGHPWIFDGSIRSGPTDGVAGQLAVVFDDRRSFAAIGLWDPDGPIRVRVLHRGTPRPIDEAFWVERVEASLDRRGTLFRDPSTTGFRLVHGENDGLGGLVADRYAETVVIKLYSAAWLPHLDAVIAALRPALSARGIDVERIVVRLSRAVRGSVGMPSNSSDATVVFGLPADRPVRFLESGVAFGADVVAGQKTGHFLDQRDNRLRVAARSRGARVLDVFACTGGFSVHAAAGGAVDVTSVDLSRRSLDSAVANWRWNRSIPEVATARHHVRVGDAFDVLADLARERRTFDVVVVDPPSFAHRARDREGALRAYRRLASMASRLVEPGGHYVQSSCSSRISGDELTDAVEAGVSDAGRRLRVEEQTGHGIDHPIGFVHGAYLSTVFARIG